MPSEITLFTTTQVAERFDVDTSTVRRWVLTGRLTPTDTTPGGHHRFTQADLDEMKRGRRS
jgi:excisionase family DNA binding protein